MKSYRQIILFCILLLSACSISVAGPWVVKSSETTLDTRASMFLLAGLDAGVDSRSYDADFSSEISLDTRINVGTVIIIR